mgnify:CR=1 FL=1
MIGEDKFLVVALVMAIIFSGLAVYLYLLDRKLSKIEKKQQELLANKQEGK